MDFRRLFLQLRRGSLIALAAPLLLALTGCPSGPGASGAAAGKMAANATAPALTQQQTAEQDTEAAQQESAADHAQKVQALITQAEASYQSGVANYNANRLDAARTDFNNAVDTMLESGMDLKNDPQLSDEFERLLDRINSLELVALKQGNGFSPKVEPAPLDEAMKEVTFPPDPALVGRLNAELRTTRSDLPLVVNDYVAGFINYFSNSPSGHAHLVASLERAGKYKEMIEKTLRQYGVPQDLIYQAVAESGFQPQALNRSSGAGGMWQFMPFAGAYGLERNGYFDERFDPEKSTVAYAKYMKFLYTQFGDWYLAMAAYDWGAGNVQRAVARTGYADFWELYRRNALPAETKNYVPGILAAVIMAKNPKQYGLTDVIPDPALVSDTVTTEYAISLELVADLTNSSLPVIVALNPALLRMTTPKDIPYDLHLPEGTKQTYLDRLKEIPEEDRDTWRFHVVKDGETLATIATALHARASAIASLNDVTEAQPIQAGDELVVPVETSAEAQQRYRTRRGDTLVTVADRFGVSVENLRAWNHLHSNRVAAGHVIYVAEPVRLAPTMRARRGRRHTRDRHARKRAHGRSTTKSAGKTHSGSAHPSKRRKK
ncbi:MAG TPA: transglycosylase SLT domain-containing protein [Acidobacteriaceae bacterium]|jgi:membrane-bound lytic murein transglycosylase D|nr:transglycosylase SLT domain-containing protein [Acidobacteriaceae bacterium]